MESAKDFYIDLDIALSPLKFQRGQKFLQSKPSLYTQPP